ncbi:MAG: alpha/beta hydrolase [Anaerolineae bacterium]|nr:alpha/beta hydrolase [Anaerolineae bacterium]
MTTIIGTDFDNPDVARLYAEAPETELAAYRAFLDAHPAKRLVIDDLAWHYLDTGGEGPPVLAPSGGLGVPEASWRTLVHLREAGYRVIAPENPTVTTMAALTEGLAGILRHEGIASAHFLGGSFGGMVGQVFVRRYPALTRSLILSHTPAPQPERNETAERYVRGMHVLPEKVLIWFMGRRLLRLLPEDTPALALTVAQVRDVIRHRATKAWVLSALRCVVDFNRQVFTPEDLAAWPGKLLILMTAGDPTTPDPVREALATLYPDAQVHLFEDTGHATALLQSSAYYAVIDAFLESADRVG